MAIKNYTTQIDAEKTIMEIESILSKHGARGILKEYNGAGYVTGVSFYIELEGNKLPFKLPLELPAWIALINQAVRDKKLPKRFLNDSIQAQRIGWRVIKDWIDAQMALIETRTVKLEQVFLPYIYDFGTKQTLYDKFLENREKFVALDYKEDEEKGVKK